MCGAEKFWSMCSVGTYYGLIQGASYYQGLYNSGFAGGMLLWSLPFLVEAISSVVRGQKCAFWGASGKPNCARRIWLLVGCLLPPLSVLIPMLYWDVYTYAESIKKNSTRGVDYTTQSCIDHPKCKTSIQVAGDIGDVLVNFTVALTALEATLLLLAIVEVTTQLKNSGCDKAEDE